MWNGTAAILNPIPATSSTSASDTVRVGSPPANASAMPRRLVVPVAP